MGWPPPNTTNQCNNVLYEQYNLPNFCAPAGPAGDGNRKKFCGLLGDGEWQFKVSSDKCKYSWCDGYTRTTGGCRGGCCSIIGRGAYCQRVAFRANSAQCCFSDYNFTGSGCVLNPPSSSSRTCDPNLRDITSDKRPVDRQNNPSKGCRTIVGEVCTNVDSSSFIQDWSVGGKCIYAMNRNLFGDSAGTISVLDGTLIPEGYYSEGAGILWARSIISKIVSELEARGKIIPSRIGDPTYTPFQETFLVMARTVPGIVADALKDTVCNGYTAETIIYDQTLTRLCGCYLADDQYSRYTDVYGVPKECTPTCTVAGAVRVINEDGYTIRNCDQDVCVIDNINITLGNNNSDVNFSQVCGGCGPDASCRCFISGYTIDASSGLIGNIDFSQSCGGETVCTDDLDRPMNCETGELIDDEPLVDGGDKPLLKFRESPYSSIVWIVFAVILLLIILLIAVNNDTSQEDATGTAGAPGTVAAGGNYYDLRSIEESLAF